MGQRVTFVGMVAKQIGKVHQACIKANGKVVCVFNDKPDEQEVAEAFKQMFHKEGVRVVDGGDDPSVMEALEHSTPNVLIVNADALSSHAQMEMQKKGRRLYGWVLLASKKPEQLASLGTPWAISFVRNVVETSIAWRNLSERPREDIINQIVVTLRSANIEVPDGLLEDRMQHIQKSQIANAIEVHAMAETMIKSARQGHRSVLKPMDVIAGMILKDNATASSGTTAAGIVKGMTPIIDEDDEDDGAHIRPRTTARVSRLDGGTPRRRPRSENPKFAVN